MKNELINVTDSELILLGEGELQADAREDLIRRLDDHPQQWRACALALLESQAVGKAIGTFADLGGELPNECFREPNHHPSKMTVTQSPRRQPWILAASVLLALAAGALFGHRISENSLAATPDVDRRLERKVAHPKMNVSVQTILERLSLGDEKLLAVVQLQHHGKRLHVPIVESQRMAEQFQRLPMPRLPSRGIREANRAGWNITQQRQLLAIETPGREVQLLPVGLWNLKPVGRDVL